MFALRIQYLASRVYASDFDDGDARQTVEWPPHPSRLYSALVSSWGEAGAEPALRPVLEWIERQPNPVLHYMPCEPRRSVNVYVPINDSRGAEALPDERPRKGRSFPSAFLPHPEVWFVWPHALPDDLEPAMQALLRRTPSLGHSASLVGIEIARSIPDGFNRLYPCAGPGGRRLRVIGEDRLAGLERSFARFSQSAAKVDRPSRGRTALYSPALARERTFARGWFREMAILRCVSGERAGLSSTLLLTTALRGALMACGPQPVPEFISGHSAESTAERPAPTAKPHIALVPLAHIGFRHATGSVGGLAVLVPWDLSAGERATVLHAFAQIRQLRMPFGVWAVAAASPEEARAHLLPETWIGPSRTWATATPYVFDRYPEDPYSLGAQETVRVSFERVGLPRPLSVSLMKSSPLTGVPPSPAYAAASRRPGKPQRFHMHVLVTFTEPIEGPVVAGAGRFYGYGFFRPLREDFE
jgi:CRISPR-associated protein Csb2